MITIRVAIALVAALPAVAVCHNSLVPQILPPPVHEHRWDRIDGAGWNYLRRGSSKDDEIVADESAPFSPPDVLKIVFTPDMQRDQEPSVHWIPVPNASEVHATWWIKLSGNWTASPAGGGKIAFFHLSPDGQGQVYANLSGGRPPHQITVNTEWAPYGQRIWTPNKAVTPIVYDRWYRMDWHVRLPDGRNSDATIRWWINGRLNGDHANVQVPPGQRGFQQFEFAPTLQEPPQHEQFMFIDHTSIAPGPDAP